MTDQSLGNRATKLKRNGTVAFIALLATSLIGVLFVAGSPANAANPTCVNGTASDSDGDGYGWENGQTCLVADNGSDQQTGNNQPAPVANASSKPLCASADSDPDGDGFGWENGQTCVVGSGIEESNPTTSPEEPVAVGVGGTEGTITVRTLREVRDSSLPAIIKEDFLESGSSSMANLSSSELDKPFAESIVVDLADARKVAEQAEVQRKKLAANPDIQGKFCSKWSSTKTEKVTLHQDNLSDSFSDNVSRDLGNGLSFEADAWADFNGSLKITADIKYQYKRNRYICVPYAARFVEATVQMDAMVSGSLLADAELTYNQRTQLWNHVLNLGNLSKSVSVKFLKFKVVASLDLVLSLDIDVQASLRASVNEQFSIRGRYSKRLYCVQTGCVDQQPLNATPVSQPFSFSHSSRNGAQATLDVQVIPSAELRLGIAFYAGDILGVIQEKIVGGTLGLVAEFPARIFMTTGNLCSDADGDGQNENVSLVMVDVTARLSAYYSLVFLSRSETTWISDLSLPTDWQIEKEENNRTSWSKNLYFNIVRQGDSSPLQPVITGVGRFNDDSEGIFLKPRSCYPLDSEPVYEIDWSTAPSSTTQHEGNGFVAHDWANNAIGETVRVRMVGDDQGRKFRGPWVSVVGTGNADIGVTPSTGSNNGSGTSNSQCVDSDGDGYGWIQATGKTCLVGDGSSNTNSSNTRTNTNSGSSDGSCVDSDGDGYGWNETTRTTCKPGLAAIGAAVAEAVTRAALGNCDYTQAARFKGYGWDPVAKRSCPPKGQ